VAEADVRDLHNRRHAVQHDDLMGPVELVGFPGAKVSGANALAVALLELRI
jgi:hypothetical protein